jgi:hypothetical protein
VKHSHNLGGPTQAKGVCRNIYNEDVYKLLDDMALSSPEQTSLGYKLNKDGWESPKKKRDGI